MRIIAGNAGGIPLQVPRSLTRPTTDRVREAIFSSLGDRVIGAVVLDLYAGTGALGLEALSRGAASATFVDHERQACDAVDANRRKARLEGAEIICRPVRTFLKQRFGSRANGTVAGSAGSEDADGHYDIVFADPPYARGSEAEVEIEALCAEPALREVLKPGGILVFESLFSAPPAFDEKAWVVARERRYGDTLVSFLNRNSDS